MRKEADLTLIHAPTVYDFRKRPGIWSPINDLVPSTPLFEMYPIGFISMTSYLGKQGYDVRIDNVAVKMLHDREFDVEKHFKTLKTKAVGIDLHWMPHTHGAIKFVEMLKEVRPEIPVIFGGLTSSYFYLELMKETKIDFIMRGDSTEYPLSLLLEGMKNEKYDDIPNLVWRDWEDNGRIKVNPLTYIPESLDDFQIDYSCLLKAYENSKNLMDFLPYKDFFKKPIMGVLTCKGCAKNCSTCGGSKFAYKNICKRDNVAFMSPEKVVEDILNIASFGSPCFIIGDLLEGGERYAKEILYRIKKEGVDIPIIFEFFSPPKRGYIKKIADAVTDFSIEISPETHDEGIRRSLNKFYTNASLFRMIDESLEAGCRACDIYFMLGLAGQTRESAKGSVKFVDGLLKEFKNKGDNKGGRGNVYPFMSPYAPFLDPGSLAFEFPEKYGYKKCCNSLMDHFRLQDKAVTWKELLSYRTNCLNASQIVDLTYEAALDLADVKLFHGLLDIDERDGVHERVKKSRRLIKIIEEAQDKGQPFSAVLETGDLNKRIFCEQKDLNWATL